MKLKMRFPGILLPKGNQQQYNDYYSNNSDQQFPPQLKQPHAGVWISGIVIILMMVFLFITAICEAQSKPVLAALNIGDKVPDITINNIINYPTKTAKISYFKGKLLILDFWATWCSPCVAMIPKMDSLQKEFNSRIQFLPVAYQSEKEVSSFMAKLQLQQQKRYLFPEILNDKILSDVFPHGSLPHFVWIDANGTIRAITDQFAVNQNNINELLISGILDIKVKKDPKLIPYDRTKPLFSDKDEKFDSLSLYRSVFTGYIERLRPGYHYDLYSPNKQRRITARNLPILSLFSNAYSGQFQNLGSHHIQLDVHDSLQLNSDKVGMEYENWMKNKHVFCYELIVPPFLAPNIFQIMQEDLRKFFPQYKAEVKSIVKDCLVLTRLSNNDKIKTKGGEPLVQADRFGFHLTNATLDYLIIQLDSFYLSNLPYPIVDGTGYKGKVDLTIDANLGNLDAINIALKKYELKFVVKKSSVEILQIKDSQPL